MMREPFVRTNEHFLTISDWVNYNIDAHFTLKTGGVSLPPYSTQNLAFHVGDKSMQVIENRQALAKSLNIPLTRWVFAAQSHSTNIYRVTSKDFGKGVHDFESGIENTDALYTDLSNVKLATFYADCTPIYFCSPKHHLIGIAHSGWVGTTNGMMYQFLSHWINDLNIDPSDIHVAIGPAISKSCYTVGKDVAEKVYDFPYFDATPALTHLDVDTYKFDAQRLNYMQAIHLGISENNILTTSYCTFADKSMFFSHRRDGNTGRMLATISQT